MKVDKLGKENKTTKKKRILRLFCCWNAETIYFVLNFE